MAASAAAAAGGGGRARSPSLPEVEAVAAEWMLEFACYCLCRRFAEGCEAEFRRWRDVAQALIHGLSETPTHQKKTVYLCQLLIRIAEGKKLECHFENDQRISPLESALSYWALLEREEMKLEKLHEDIRRLLQIQAVAVHMENGYFKEAAEVLERLFTDSESDKPLRVKLATIIKGKDPYVPLLQSFNYNLLINKTKSYVEIFMKENETNFLIQAAAKQLESKGLDVTALQSKTGKVDDSDRRSLDTKGFVLSILLLRDMLGSINDRATEYCKSITCRLKKIHGKDSSRKEDKIDECSSEPEQLAKCEKKWRYFSLWPKTTDETTRSSRTSPVQAAEVSTDKLNGTSPVQAAERWTYKEDLELMSGVKEFGVGNWAKILVHGDFNNRTSVMLKDRWRTLCRNEQC